VRLDKLGGRLVPRDAASRRWMAVSAVIHVVVIGLVVLSIRAIPRPQVQFIQLDDGGGAESAMPAYHPPAGTTHAAAPRPLRVQPAPAPEESAVTAVVPQAITPAAPVAVAEVDSLPIDPHATIEPRYGDGRLWIRVSDAVSGNLPARRAAREMPDHVARVDSALAEKIRTYMDTVPPDSFATREGPKWTTQIAGQTWGIDGKWIYLGPIKLPAMVLALLPLPSGNYELAQRNMQLQRMREDLLQAAQRATNAVEFKKYVKELRERKEAEHQQRIPPDTTSRVPLIP